MNMRKNFDISAYLVVGPARELIALCREAADVLRELGKSDEVVLLVNDRLDVALAAREAGIKVDGIHVGQSDIPAGVCRKYLGDDAVIGLSARDLSMRRRRRRTAVAMLRAMSSREVSRS